MKSLNEKVVSEINRKLPKNTTAVNYLMNLLYLGKESAYRRLKGQIPFTFEEVIAIANDLGFSLDKITGKEKGGRVFFDINTDLTKSFSDLYINSLKSDIKIIKELSSVADLKILSALNRIPLRFLPFKNLFKFDYLRFLHSKGALPVTVNFSDAIPDIVNELHKEAVYAMSRLDNVTCVINDAAFSKIIKIIQYSYHTEIVSYEDLKLLQKELFEMLAFFEKLITTGVNDSGASYSIYHSMVEPEANCICCEYGDYKMSQVWLSPESPIIVNDDRLMYQIQKNWLESKIKYATLMTKSNELLRSKIMRNLRDQIAVMTKDQH